MAMVRNVEVMLEQNSEPLCEEFSKIVQYHISVNYLTFCLSIRLCAALNNFGTEWFKFITAF
jgi:hypothetical protein